MTEKQPNGLAMHYILIGVVIIVVIGAWYFWPEKEPESRQQLPTPVVETPPVVIEPEPEPVVTTPEPVEVVEEPAVITAEPQPEPEPAPEPEPLDTSDATVKTKLLALADYETLAHLLVDDALLARFVVTVDNLARHDVAPNHQLLKAPKQSFKTYQQGGKEWIDAASYKRYNLYVDMLETMSTPALLNLYREYKPALEQHFAEIAQPNANFDERLMSALDNLLDTPEIPKPVEVYTNSVMYKYRNDVLENLSAPQKQLLRTGPDNMRRIKNKLRELKAALQASGSE